MESKVSSSNNSINNLSESLLDSIISNLNLVSPTIDTHAVNKEYVDDAINSVVAGGIADNSITSVKLQDNIITTSKIGDNQITAGKLNFPMTISNTTPSSSYNTGSLVLNGGLSINNDTNSSSETSGGALSIKGGVSIGRDLRLSGNSNLFFGDSAFSLKFINVNLSPNTSYLQFGDSTGYFFRIRNGLENNLVSFQDNGITTFHNNSDNAVVSVGGIEIQKDTQSTDPATGSLRTSGGVGIVKNLNVGGSITGSSLVSGDISSSSLVNFTSSSLGLPSFTTRSIGSRVVLKSNTSSSTTDTSIGLDISNFWFSASTENFSFYNNTTLTGRINNNGFQVQGVVDGLMLNKLGDLFSSGAFSGYGRYGLLKTGGQLQTFVPNVDSFGSILFTRYNVDSTKNDLMLLDETGVNVFNRRIKNVSNPIENNDVINKQFLDTSLSSTLTSSNNYTDSKDLIRKNYIDTEISNISSSIPAALEFNNPLRLSGNNVSYKADNIYNKLTCSTFVANATEWTRINNLSNSNSSFNEASNIFRFPKKGIYSIMFRSFGNPAPIPGFTFSFIDLRLKVNGSPISSTFMRTSYNLGVGNYNATWVVSTNSDNQAADIEYKFSGSNPPDGFIIDCDIHFLQELI